MTIQTFVRKACVALCALFALSSVSSAQSLTIHGVNPEMNYEDVISTLKQRSRHCEGFETWKSSTGEYFQAVSCSSLNITSDDHPDIIVIATDRGQLVKMRFECSATRTCGLNEDAVIQALIKANVLPEGISRENRFPGRFRFKDQNRNEIVINSDPNDQSILLNVNEEKIRKFDF